MESIIRVVSDGHHEVSVVTREDEDMPEVERPETPPEGAQEPRQEPERPKEPESPEEAPAPAPTPPEGKTFPPASSVPVYDPSAFAGWASEVIALRTRQFAHNPAQYADQASGRVWTVRGSRAFPGGLNLGGTKLYLRPGADISEIDGLYYRDMPNERNHAAIEVSPGASIDVLRNFEIHGPYGKGTEPMALHCRPAYPDRIGHVRLIEDGCFRGWNSDMCAFGSAPGVETMVRRVHFGPQWAVPGSGAHCDLMNIRMMLGDITFERCLFDRLAGHDPTAHVEGVNNAGRIGPINGKVARGTGTIRFRQCIIDSDLFRSFVFQVKRTTQFSVVLDFEDCRLTGQKLFHSGGQHVTRWVNVVDHRTGLAIPPPNLLAATV